MAARGRGQATIEIDLEWQALVQPGASYTVFVHLFDRAGKVAAQHDGLRLHGTFPTTFWDAGDLVAESVVIALPDHLEPGTYPVEVGLDRLETGERLATPTGATSVVVGSVTVP